MTPAKTAKRRIPREKTAAQTTVALIPGHPAGTILTRAAGTSRVEATLAGKEPLIIEDHIIQQVIFDDIGGGARGSFSQREGEGGSLMVEGEIMALDRGCMGRAVEAVMRRVSEAAALLDAALEMRAVREAEPEAASEEMVYSLGRDLSEAGFPVYTGVLWSPSPGGDVWLGEDGEYAEALRDFIEARPAWRAV